MVRLPRITPLSYNLFPIVLFLVFIPCAETLYFHNEARSSMCASYSLRLLLHVAKLLMLLLLLTVASSLLLQLLNLHLLLLQYLLHCSCLFIKLSNLLLLLPLTVLKTVGQVADLVLQVVHIGPNILFRGKKVGTVAAVTAAGLLVMWWLRHLWLKR